MKLGKNNIVKLLEIVPVIVIIINLIFREKIDITYIFVFLYYMILMCCEINYCVDFKKIFGISIRIILFMTSCNLLLQINNYYLEGLLYVIVLTVVCVQILCITLYCINFVVLNKCKSKKYVVVSIFMLVYILLIIPVSRYLIEYEFGFVNIAFYLSYFINAIFLLFKLKKDDELKKVYRVVFIYFCSFVFIYVGIFVLPRGLTYGYKDVDKIVVTYTSLNSDYNNALMFEIEDTRELYNTIRFANKISNSVSTGINSDSEYNIIIIYKNGEEDILRSVSSGKAFVRNYQYDDYVVFNSNKILQQLYKEGVIKIEN